MPMTMLPSIRCSYTNGFKNVLSSVIFWELVQFRHRDDVGKLLEDGSSVSEVVAVRGTRRGATFGVRERPRHETLDYMNVINH
jgi:hypothetical protein